MNCVRVRSTGAEKNILTGVVTGRPVPMIPLMGSCHGTM